MRRNTTFAIMLSAFSLSACADSSSEIAATYISPLQYQSFTCPQLAEEARRVSSRAAELSGVQDKKATNDAVVTGVAIVLFWPAAFFIGGNKETRAQLSRLKGELEAIEQASIRKNCGIEFKKA